MKPVPGYYRYTSYSGTTASWDFFIRAEDDYESRISQTANSISLSVENEDRGTMAEIAMTNNEIHQTVEDKESQLRSEIIQNSDAIDMTVSGSNAKVKSGSSSYTGVVYNRVPKWNGTAFEFLGKDNESEPDSMPISADALTAGYRYSAGTMDVACGPADSVEAKVGALWYTRGTGAGTYSAIYRKTYQMETDEDGLKTVVDGYVVDPNGSYINVGTDENPEYKLVESWVKPVPGYYRYTSYSGTTASWDFFIRAEDDYESRISQTANSISLSVENETGTVGAALGLFIDEDGLSHIRITGNRFYLKSDYTELREDGHFITTSGKIANWTIGTNLLSAGDVGMYSGSDRALTSLISGTSSVRFYAGGDGTSTSTKFLVLNDGSLYTQYIKASGGQIGSFYLTSSGYLTSNTSKTTYTSTTTGVFIGTTGIGLGQNKFTVSSAGYMTSTSGKIANWTIGTNLLSAGDVGMYSGSDRALTSLISGTSSVRFYAGGDGTSTSTKFLVLNDGSLYTQYIKASGGQIGGWEISDNNLHYNIYNDDGSLNKGTGFQPPNTGTWAIAVAYTNYSSWSTAPFRVSHSGAMHASSGTIAGWTFNANKMYGLLGSAYYSGISFDSTSIGGEPIVFFAGANHHTNITGFNFAVSAYGSLVASSVTGISVTSLGDIAAGGNISALTASIPEINSDEITVARIRSNQYSSNWIDMYYSSASTESQAYTASVRVESQGLTECTIRVSLNTNLKSGKTFTVTYSNIFNGNQGSTTVYIPAGSSSGTGTISKFWAITDDRLSVSPSGFTQYYNTGGGGIDCHADFNPYSTSYKLGNTTYYWSAIYVDCVYLKSSSVDWSDKRFKKNIKAISDKYDDFYYSLKPSEYQFVDGKRKHFGLVANDMKEEMDKHNIDSMDFAPFVEFDLHDNRGNVTGETRYGIRYSELIPHNMYQIQKLKARIDELEKIITRNLGGHK